MSTRQTRRLRSVATEGAVVNVAITVEHESRTVHIDVPRRTRDTTDEEFAGMIERMSRARRAWLDRGYRVKFIK